MISWTIFAGFCRLAIELGSTGHCLETVKVASLNWIERGKSSAVRGCCLSTGVEIDRHDAPFLGYPQSQVILTERFEVVDSGTAAIEGRS
jgi:hypothetical protein